MPLGLSNIYRDTNKLPINRGTWESNPSHGDKWVEGQTGEPNPLSIINIYVINLS